MSEENNQVSTEELTRLLKEAETSRETMRVSFELSSVMATQLFKELLAFRQNAHHGERAIVQLAGCGVAAMGHITGEQLATPGMYGWSASYGDVVKLRQAFDKLTSRSPDEVLAATDVRSIETLDYEATCLGSVIDKMRVQHSETCRGLDEQIAGLIRTINSFPEDLVRGVLP